MNEMITLGQAKPEVQRKFMTGVYLRMTLALFISATVAYFASNSYAVLSFLFSNGGIPFYALLVAELILVVALSAAIHKLSSFTAMAFFLLYAVMNGLSFCTIFILYEVSSIYTMFLVSALMFAGMSIYGAKTKSDLTSAGRYLYYGLDWNYRRGTCKYVLALERAGLDYKFDWSGTFHRHHGLRHSAAYANCDSR